MSLVATNTPQHLATRYVAYMQVASAAGSVAGPVIGGLLASWVGIRGALNLSGTNVLVSVILVILIVKEPNKVKGGVRSTLLEDFSTALKSDALMRVIWITVLAMIGSVSLQPVITLYISQLAESPERATTISGMIFALPGLALILTANAWSSKASGADTAMSSKPRCWERGSLGSAWPYQDPSSFLLCFSSSRESVWRVFVPSRPRSSRRMWRKSFAAEPLACSEAANTIGGLSGPMVAGFVEFPVGPPAAFFVIGVILAVGAVYLRVHEEAPAEKRSDGR